MIGMSENKAKCVPDVSEERDFPALFEYENGSDAYKKLVEWVYDGNYITLAVFEEGLKGLETLKQPENALRWIIDRRKDTECKPLEAICFDWRNFDSNRYDRMSAALLDAVKKIDNQISHMHLLEKLYTQNESVQDNYCSHILPDFFGSLEAPHKALFDRHDKALVEAAVEARNLNGPSGFYPSALFYGFYSSPYFLSALKGVDDRAIVNIVAENKQNSMAGSIGRKERVAFLLDVQNRVASGELKNIDLDVLRTGIEDLSADMLLKECFSRAVGGDVVSFSIKPFSDDEKDAYRTIFAEVDSAMGYENHVLTKAFELCLVAEQDVLDTLEEHRKIDQAAAEQKAVLSSALTEKLKATQTACQNIFKIK